MPWIKLTFEAARDVAQALGDALEEAGAASVSLEGADNEPIFETDWNDNRPVWKQARIEALFEEDADIESALKMTAALLGANELPPHQTETVADQDWVRVWMDRWQPMHFGGQLWVVPSWLTPPDPNAVNLILDPGMAFGTGTHATTGMCLRWLAVHPPRGREVVDYGCGSGILAIAALMLGAHVRVATPKGYALRPEVAEQARRIAVGGAEFNRHALRCHVLANNEDVDAACAQDQGVAVRGDDRTRVGGRQRDPDR